MNKTFIEEQQKIAREYINNNPVRGTTYENNINALISQIIFATEADTLARVREKGEIAEELAEKLYLGMSKFDRTTKDDLRDALTQAKLAERLRIRLALQGVIEMGKSALPHNLKKFLEEDLTPPSLESDKTDV